MLLILINLAVVFCHLDLSMGFGSEKRLPFETFLFLFAWGWTGSLTVWEAVRQCERYTAALPARSFSKGLHAKPARPLVILCR